MDLQLKGKTALVDWREHGHRLRRDPRRDSPPKA
jgi:hypothetical protein